MQLSNLVLNLGPARSVQSDGVEYHVETVAGGACRIRFMTPHGRAIRVIAPGSRPGWSAGFFERFWVYAGDVQIANAVDTFLVDDQRLRQLLERCFHALEAEARVVTEEGDRRENASREAVLSRL